MIADPFDDLTPEARQLPLGGPARRDALTAAAADLQRAGIITRPGRPSNANTPTQPTRGRGHTVVTKHSAPTVPG